LDQALGLIEGTSPGLVRLASRAAAREGFEAASDDLKELAGIHIDGRQIQRLVAHSGPRVAVQLKLTGPEVETKPMPICYVEADGTGIPRVARELAGRKGRQADGTAQTREVKLGCVFSQTKTDEEGRPVRDHQSTSYVGTLASVESFAPLLRDEARRRGMGQSQKIVFIGDGAAWIWELARTHFPLAILILDFYHRMEYLHELSQRLYGKDTPWASRMKDQWKEQMEKDQVQAVIGQRLKQSGMFWSQSGAENILALRCALMSHRWDQCWNQINHPLQFPSQPTRAAA
jgi:hypothetical protein